MIFSTNIIRPTSIVILSIIIIRQRFTNVRSRIIISQVIRFYSQRIPNKKCLFFLHQRKNMVKRNTS